MSNFNKLLHLLTFQLQHHCHPVSIHPFPSNQLTLQVLFQPLASLLTHQSVTREVLPLVLPLLLLRLLLLQWQQPLLLGVQLNINSITSQEYIHIHIHIHIRIHIHIHVPLSPPYQVTLILTWTCLLLLPQLHCQPFHDQTFRHHHLPPPPHHRLLSAVMDVP